MVFFFSKRFFDFTIFVQKTLSGKLDWFLWSISFLHDFMVLWMVIYDYIVVKSSWWDAFVHRFFVVKTTGAIISWPKCIFVYTATRVKRLNSAGISRFKLKFKVSLNSIKKRIRVTLKVFHVIVYFKIIWIIASNKYSSSFFRNLRVLFTESASLLTVLLYDPLVTFPFVLSSLAMLSSPVILANRIQRSCNKRVIKRTM